MLTPSMEGIRRIGPEPPRPTDFRLNQEEEKGWLGTAVLDTATLEEGRVTADEPDPQSRLFRMLTLTFGKRDICMYIPTDDTGYIPDREWLSAYAWRRRVGDGVVWVRFNGQSKMKGKYGNYLALSPRNHR